MTITFEAIAKDPGLFFFAVDGQDALIQTMTRENFHRSIFLDQRIKRGDNQLIRLPLDTLLSGYNGPPATERPCGYIFHVAQCGSTLLARALDLPDHSLVLREPIALRQLGIEASEEGADGAKLVRPRFKQMLELTTSMLGKRYTTEQPVIVKANVPVNFCADDIMAVVPDAPALLLYFPLDTYLAAVMRTKSHENWVEKVYAELHLSKNIFTEANEPRTTATRAAALWFAQMKKFEDLQRRYSNVHSLHSGHFFAQPGETIFAAAQLYGVPMDLDQAATIVDSELFSSYAKNPALDYDQEVRGAREVEAKLRLAPQIREAIQWAIDARNRFGLPEALIRPLVGEAARLIAL